MAPSEVAVQFEREADAVLFAAACGPDSACSSDHPPASLGSAQLRGDVVTLDVTGSLGAVCDLLTKTLSACGLASATVRADGRSFLLSTPLGSDGGLRGLAARRRR